MSTQFNKSNNRNYSRIITNLSSGNDNTNVHPTKYVTSGPIIIPRHRGCQSVRNQLAKNSNSSYDIWEFTYFQHILDLCDIFKPYADKLGIDIDNIDFLDVFAHFINDCSSGEINSNIEELSKQTENFYMDFTILRNT